MSQFNRTVVILGGAVAAACLPLTISSPISLEIQQVGQIVRLNTACAEEGGGCKLNLLYICETAHGNERGYRNVTQPTPPVQEP
jgi:hypothetical protein